MKYDDFIVGETFKTKSLHITEEEIVFKGEVTALINNS